MAGFSEQDLFQSVDFNDLIGGFGIDFGGLHGGIGGSLFEGLFGRRRKGPKRGENIEVELRIPLAQVVSGGEAKVRLERSFPCTSCKGSGAKAGTKPRTCPDCKGSGRRISSNRRHDGPAQVRVQHISDCTTCSGRGQLIDEACAACHGSGKTVVEEALTVNVPVGADEGLALRVPGYGQPAPAEGAAPGDLFVVVRTLEDPRFERDGADLWHTEQISVPEAVLGTTRQVPALDQAAEVTIASGTQPGTVLCLAGRGLPCFGGQRRGDYFVRLQVAVPTKLGPRERDLYEQLRDMALPASPDNTPAGGAPPFEQKVITEDAAGPGPAPA